MWITYTSRRSKSVITTYHVGIPYYYHFYVEADTEEEAIEKAHNSEGSMGEYDENNIFVETVPNRKEDA